MHLQDGALVLAGVIGGGTAAFHGILTQRHIVRPMARLFLTDDRISAPIRAITPPLLQFSTYNWLLGGFALIAAALWCEGGARIATGLLVGSSYLYGAICNCWATRGRHPGWMLMAVAVVLIGFGLRTG